MSNKYSQKLVDTVKTASKRAFKKQQKQLEI